MLRVADEIFELFPDLTLGVVSARGIDNSGRHPQVEAALRDEEARVRDQLGQMVISEHPHVSPWRTAYRAFGAKPKEHPSSLENLLRRVVKGQNVPRINTLVDIYNVVSLRHLVPAGGEDLDAIEGDVVLTRAGAQEPPVRLLGENEERPPHPGEVIYRDDRGAICRRFNWKEADRTKLTTETRNALLVIEGLPPVERSAIDRALADLATRIQSYCGGSIATGVVDISKRAFS